MDPRECVEWVIALKRIDEPERHWLLAIPSCESGWRVDPPHDNESRGLYQFEPATWESTPYGRHSIYSARYQSLAADWGYRNLPRGPGEWSCTAILGLG